MQTKPPPLSLRRRAIGGAILAPLMLGLMAGCASTPETVDSTVTGSIAQPTTAAEFDQSVEYWGTRYKADTTAKEPALSYAAALIRVGRTQQAVAVLQTAAIHHPTDRDVLAAYGKALAAAGNFDLAIDTIHRAQTPDQPDWKLMSAEAAILDQVGRNGEARKLYERALVLAPNEPSVLSNYGMSYVLTGDLASAEKLLRKAIAQPGADSRVRQNLALVVGLQGRFSEAEAIAGEELSPEQAKENIAFLRRMLAQRNTWEELKASGETG